MIYAFDDYELDEDLFELRRAGVRQAVQPKVLSLLLYLASQGERMVPKEELLRELWPGVHVGEGSLARAAKEARRAIGDDEQRIVTTVRTRGLRWAGTLERRQTRTAPPVENRVLLRQELKVASETSFASLAALAREVTGVQLVVMALAS